MPTISILLAESHLRLRCGIRRLLENHPAFRVISEATGAAEAIRLAEECGPHIVVTETVLADSSGIEVARQLSTRRRGIGFVFLSMHSEIAYVVSSMKAGGRGYVLKNTANQDLPEAIYAVNGGSTFHSPVITWLLAEDCMQRLREQPKGRALSNVEREVIQLFAKGKSSQEIGLHLGLDPSATEAHRFEGLQKVYLAA